MHPLSWVFITLWITSLAVLIRSPLLLALLFALATGMIFLSRGKAGWRILLGLKRLLPLFLTLIIIQSLFRPGKELIFSLGFIHVSKAGFELGLLVSLRLMILLISASILGRLGYQDFRNAFLYLPEEISFMISYVVHLIPGIRKEYLHYLEVLRWRGIILKEQPIRRRLHLYKTISISVLAGLLSGSTMQAVSLELRGFRRPGIKTFLYRQKTHLRDHLLWAVLLVLLVLLIFSPYI
ncbi:MAG TPA: energy-coupling factor transporter transmembrane component T [Candidatus Cloacimonadota bacterium]|nr:energy-coupling factor transporter transmembrane component T [Candidatus Cloacimonadota bacterium]HPS38715.1 energy-coupling factor transporter transmembrane component T [Candidatus Cloacimonadota bacterium]